MSVRPASSALPALIDPADPHPVLTAMHHLGRCTSAEIAAAIPGGRTASSVAGSLVQYERRERVRRTGKTGAGDRHIEWELASTAASPPAPQTAGDAGANGGGPGIDERLRRLADRYAEAQITIERVEAERDRALSERDDALLRADDLSENLAAALTAREEDLGSLEHARAEVMGREDDLREALGSVGVQPWPRVLAAVRAVSASRDDAEPASDVAEPAGDEERAQVDFEHRVRMREQYFATLLQLAATEDPSPDLLDRLERLMDT